MYERVIVPWVQKYESRVDDAIDGAHRDVQRWIWSKMGHAMALVVGESGNLLEILLELIFGKPSVTNNDNIASKQSQQQSAAISFDQSQSSATSSVSSTERQQPKHSVRDALRQTSTLEDFVVVDGNSDTKHSIEFMAEYVNDFKSMMQQGLYVFANVGTDDSINNTGKFRLGVFSYDVNNFLISPVGTEEKSAAITLPLCGLSAPICTGSQGIILEWIGERLIDGATTTDETKIRAEIVLTTEDDRDILFNCLTKCLPWMRA